jgi:hypothetical protein
LDSLQQQVPGCLVGEAEAKTFYENTISGRRVTTIKNGEKKIAKGVETKTNEWDDGRSKMKLKWGLIQLRLE